MKKSIYGISRPGGGSARSECTYKVPAQQNINSYMNRAISSVSMIKDRTTKDFALQRLDLITADLRIVLGLPASLPPELVV